MSLVVYHCFDEIYMSHFSYACKTERQNGISCLISELLRTLCCDMNQSDTIGKIELIPSIVLSSDNTDCKNDIQLFPQLFDELSVHTDYH